MEEIKRLRLELKYMKEQMKNVEKTAKELKDPYERLASLPMLNMYKSMHTELSNKIKVLQAELKKQKETNKYLN